MTDNRTESVWVRAYGPERNAAFIDVSKSVNMRLKYKKLNDSEAWLEGDIEGFVQPVLVTDSRQLPFR